MSVLYPLRFQPILRCYMWGGRRLESLGKQLGPGSDYAESWEIVDRGADQSVVTAGPLAGRTLGELVREFGQPLLGRHAGHQRFPLLFKFLDAQQRLSLQVHPDDAHAAALDPPDLGKSEAWVILEAQPRSYIYAGLLRGIDRDMLKLEIARHTVELCCERIEPRAGNCYFLPAGVVHAIGPGLLVAEIQEASDTTYRLYDYDRVGPDGRRRELHVALALDAIDYDYGPVAAQQPQPTDVTGVERLVACDHFVLDRWTLSGPHRTRGDDRCHILAVLEGAIEVAGDPVGQPLSRGGSMLVPAELGAVDVRVRDRAVVLDAYLP
ncbi:MAG: type I phosphomannose isomerase catalytic subunit [Pirellulales bacterium]